MPAILYPIISAIFFAQVVFLQKVIANKAKSSAAISFWFQFLASLFYIVFFFFEAPHWHFSDTSLILLILSSLAYSVFNIIVFESNKHIDISIGSVIAQLSLVFTFTAFTIVFSEAVTLQKLVGVGLIIIGNILLFLKKNLSFKKTDTLGIILRIISTVVLSTALVFDAKNSPEFSLTYYAFLVFIVPAFFVLIYTLYKKQGKEIITDFSQNKLILVAMSFTGAIGYWSLIKSYSVVDKTIASPINSSYTILVVLMGIIFLNETKDIRRKILAVLIVFAGAVILGVA